MDGTGVLAPVKMDVSKDMRCHGLHDSMSIITEHSMFPETHVNEPYILHVRTLCVVPRRCPRGRGSLMKPLQTGRILKCLVSTNSNLTRVFVVFKAKNKRCCSGRSMTEAKVQGGIQTREKRIGFATWFARGTLELHFSSRRSITVFVEVRKMVD